MLYCFWLELNCAFLSAVVFLWPKGPQGPITNPLCSFKMPRHQLEYLTGCYSVPHKKNIHFSSTRLESDSSSRCEYWVRVNRWWRAEMAEGSELSSLPARLSPCTGMLAHITLRNASSNIFPAGRHSSTQSIQHIHTHTHTHTSPKKRDVCQMCTISICCCPSALFLVCMCMQIGVFVCVYVCACVSLL